MKSQDNLSYKQKLQVEKSSRIKGEKNWASWYSRLKMVADSLTLCQRWGRLFFFFFLNTWPLLKIQWEWSCATLESQEIVSFQFPFLRILTLGNKQHAMPPKGSWRGLCRELRSLINSLGWAPSQQQHQFARHVSKPWWKWILQV